jgi:hypothetical protein
LLISSDETSKKQTHSRSHALSGGMVKDLGR